MDFEFNADQLAIYEGVEKICGKYDRDYWRKIDQDELFPDAFYRDIAQAGMLGIMMPTEYGGAGLGLVDAAMIMQRVVESGGGMTAATCMHSYIFAPNPLVVHGSEALRQELLPPLMRGDDRAAFGITEPNTGLDTTRLKTRAVRKGDYYEVHGQKIWTTGALIANRILLIARTTPIEETRRPIDGLSLFYADFDRSAIEVRAIPKMGLASNASCELFIDGLKIPVERRLGEEGKGFHYLLDGLNPERVLVAAEAIGLGRMAIQRATQYAKDRVVFDRPIGMNQAIQHPLAECWAELEAAQLMMLKAATLYDQGKPCGPFANAAKYLGAEGGFKACTQAIMTHGGMGYAKEFDVERFLREVMVPKLAPVSPQMILNYISEKVLGLPKSY